MHAVAAALTTRLFDYWWMIHAWEGNQMNSWTKWLDRKINDRSFEASFTAQHVGEVNKNLVVECWSGSPITSNMMAILKIFKQWFSSKISWSCSKNRPSWKQLKIWHVSGTDFKDYSRDIPFVSNRKNPIPTYPHQFGLQRHRCPFWGVARRLHRSRRPTCGGSLALSSDSKSPGTGTKVPEIKIM